MQQDPQISRGNAGLLTNILSFKFIEGAQSEDLGLPFWQGRKALTHLLPELGVFTELGWVAGPGLRRTAPMVKDPVPLIQLLGWQRFERRVTRCQSDAVHDLVAQNAHQPGQFGAVTAEGPLSLEGGQQGLLNGVLSVLATAQAGQGIAEQVVRVRVHPLVGIGACGPRFWCGTHQGPRQQVSGVRISGCAREPARIPD